MPKGTCSFEECDKPAFSRQLCQMHYMRLRRAGELLPIKRRTTCEFDDCDKKVLARDLCAAHYMQRQRGAELQPLRHRPTCSFRGCNKPNHSSGLCSAHYEQQRHGKTLKPLRFRADGPPEERFGQKYVELPNGCWQWLGSKSTDGYGTFSVGGKGVSAHRFSYQMHVGPILTDLQLDHLCRNRACVNPEHLEPVTGKENRQRGETLQRINSTKTHCLNGHEFTLQNTHYDPDGHRGCKTCANERMQGYRAQRRVREMRDELEAKRRSD